VFILSLLALDLFVLNRKAHEIAVGEALKWTAMFVSIALAFTVVVYFMYDNHWLGQGLPPPGATDQDGNPQVGISGTQAAIEFLTGYIVEYSLSMDNIFVIAVIFGLLRRATPLPAPRALLGHPRRPGHARHHDRGRRGWSIGSIGFSTSSARSWCTPALKMLLAKEKDSDPERNLWSSARPRKFLVIAQGFRPRRRFITRLPDGRRGFVTLLFLALVIVEFTDVIFAVDSIPAIFAVTLRPLPGVHLQRLRDPRAALALLRCSPASSTSSDSSRSPSVWS
jgi:tellurite resistance protein TerC